MKKSILICGTVSNIHTSRNEFKLNVTIELRYPLAKKKMRLRVWGYTNREYLYMLTGGSLTVKHKTFTIKSLDEALEA